MSNNIYEINPDIINYSTYNDNNLQTKEDNINTIENKDTIIKFNIEDINRDNIRRSNSRWTSSQFGNTYRTESLERSKQFNISPIVRRTPNTKADIIIQKIYTNRKNVIKNYQNTSTEFRDIRPLTNSSSLIDRNLDKIRSFNKIDNNSQNNDKLYNYESDANLVNNDKNNLIVSYKKSIEEDSLSNDIPLSRIINKNNEESPSIKDSSSSDGSPDKSVISLSDESVNSDMHSESIFDRNTEKRKRRYYRTIKLKKDKNEKIKPLNINEIETPKQSPTSSPRDITQDLWNDSVENYYIEFQKLCKEEADKYKYLSHRNELISNLLKFILLISGCFTFTLSISIPSTLFMSTTTTISSCLTAIITSLTGFFQFDKKSEIQYNIYRELDKLYNTISLEMLKPTYMRPDPYEYILSLRNRRDELLKTLQKK
jgi:hypothetical protein